MRRGPAPLALVVYAGFSLVTLGVSFALDRNPLEIDAGAHHVLSFAGGLVLALLTVGATRALVKRTGWAKLLHADLRPAVRGAGDATLVVLGIASGVAEELFFRGLLVPALGLAVSSVVFGAVHRLRGRAGWIWAVWAGGMGFLFGGLFLATGSLVGPLVGHVAINVMNLRFLRDTDVEPRKPRHLGGLLGRA